MTIKEAVSEYLEWKASYARPASKAYKSCVDKLLMFSLNLEDLTQLHIVRFVEHYSKTRKPRTICWYVNILKDFFAYYRGRCQVNSKLIRRPKFTSDPPNFLTEEEFNKMDKCLDQNLYTDLQKKVMIRILWRTGIRVSELSDLDVSDIQEENNYTRIITKKNKKHRWIMWTEEDHRLLLRYVETRLRVSDEEALFITNDYRWRNRISTRSIERMIVLLAIRAGLDRRINPHMFRHGKAHFMLRKKANLNEVKDILGHTHIFSTQMYAKLLPNELRELASQYL